MLDGSIVLLHPIIQIVHQADHDRRARRLRVSPHSGRVGLTPVDSARLGGAMAADGLGEEACGCSLVPMCREQEIGGKATGYPAENQVASILTEPYKGQQFS